jgi:hypothetical protein
MRDQIWTVFKLNFSHWVVQASLALILGQIQLLWHAVELLNVGINGFGCHKLCLGILFKKTLQVFASVCFAALFTRWDVEDCFGVLANASIEDRRNR